ncbi:MAG: hypothetical protein R2694_11330 [Ilumatobacteraceae bacterium]
MNLAALLRDGERVYVPEVGETVPVVVTGAGGGGGGEGEVTPPWRQGR